MKGLDGQDGGGIVTRRINICRHSELNQLKGLRLLMSMFLELAAGPYTSTLSQPFVE